MNQWVIAACLVAYLVGSVPWGYLVCRWLKGLDIRDHGSHNIGFTNVLRVVGAGPALLTLIGDIAKGALSVYIARRCFYASGWSQAYIMIVILSTMLGHGASLYFLITGRGLEGGKSVATGFGGLIIFNWQIATFCAATWFLTLAIFRYMSLASLAGAVSFAIALWYSQADRSTQFVSLVAVGFIFLKHLPNIQRLLDGREPKFWDRTRAAASNIPTCALYIHKIHDKDWEQSIILRWIYRLAKRLGVWLIVESIVERFCPPMYFGEVKGVLIANRPIKVIVIGIPLRPETILTNKKLAVNRAIEAACMARRLGATTVGLLGFNSIVGNSGRDVQKAMGNRITITNGGALTAAVSKRVISHLIVRNMIPAQPVIGIVGPYGVVGSGISQSVLYLAEKLILIRSADDQAERPRIKRLLEHQKRELLRLKNDASIDTSTSLNDCQQCDVLFIATSSPYPLINARHIKTGAAVVDFGRPSTVDQEVLERTDFTVIRGGDIKIPSARSSVDFGTGHLDEFPACAVETMLIGGLDASDRQTLGQPTPKNMAFFDEYISRGGFQVMCERLNQPPQTG